MPAAKKSRNSSTESDITKTWLWADANSKVRFPASSLKLCRKVRRIGRKLGLKEFGADQFPFVDEIGKPDSDTLAMVATFLAGASCYYRCPHKKGTAFVALSSRRIDKQPDLDQEGFGEAFNYLMWVPGNMKRRCISYLSAKGYIEKGFDGTNIKCKLHTGEEIRLSFKVSKKGERTISFVTERKKKGSRS